MYDKNMVMLPPGATQQNGKLTKSIVQRSEWCDFRLIPEVEKIMRS